MNNIVLKLISHNNKVRISSVDCVNLLNARVAKTSASKSHQSDEKLC